MCLCMRNCILALVWWQPDRNHLHCCRMFIVTNVSGSWTLMFKNKSYKCCSYYNLNSWGSCLLDNPMSPQLIKLPPFYAIQKTASSLWYCPRWIRSTIFLWFLNYVLILSFRLWLDFLNGLIPSPFSAKPIYKFSLSCLLAKGPILSTAMWSLEYGATLRFVPQWLAYLWHNFKVTC
jgi:hypothetical protein